MATRAVDKRISLDALGAIALRQTDSDKLKRWGGVIRADTTGTPIAELQTALTAVGVYTSTIDGDFGAGTQLALRRFQWFVVNSRYRLQVAAGAAVATGAVQSYLANGSVAVTGQCDVATACELLDWVASNVRTTSLLVRFPLSLLPRTTRAPTFTTLTYPAAAAGEVLINGNFGGLQTLDAATRTPDVDLRLNQTFRVEGVAPRGAVVTPATRSQHLIGHAVDLNIVTGSTVVTSAMFIAGRAPKAATDFVAAAVAQGLRWGGNFSDIDPPHFDDPVASTSEAYEMNFFFCQRSYALRHPLRLLES